jgi:hypothetical protein
LALFVVRGRRGAAPERGLGVLHGEAGAALLGPRLAGRAAHAVALLAEREVEGDLRRRFRIGVIRAHALGFTRSAGGVAVEREADRVEDAGFARAGWAVDQEEGACPQCGEIEDLLRRIGAEGAHVQPEGPHCAPPVSNARIEDGG